MAFTGLDDELVAFVKQARAILTLKSLIGCQAVDVLQTLYLQMGMLLQACLW